MIFRILFVLLYVLYIMNFTCCVRHFFDKVDKVPPAHQNLINITNVKVLKSDPSLPTKYRKVKSYTKTDFGNGTIRLYNDKKQLEEAIVEVIKDVNRARNGIRRIFRCVDDPNISCYPYHVAYGSNCGGVLIHHKWALTAAHCGKNVYIRIGSRYINQGRKIAIKYHYPHKMWMYFRNFHFFDYDYQLLELDENLSFDENVAPVKIGYIDDVVPGKFITVSGWGVKGWRGSHFNILHGVRVPIVDKERCQRSFTARNQGNLTPRMICAGFDEGLRDACHGDSGGPAVFNGRLLGLVSFGYGCAEPHSYGVYSNVVVVRAWIENVTGLVLN